MNPFINLTMCSAVVVSSVGMISCAPEMMNAGLTQANAVANTVAVAKNAKIKSVSLVLTGLT